MVRSEVLTAVIKTTAVFWNIKPRETTVFTLSLFMFDPACRIVLERAKIRRMEIIVWGK
jgi:hypothetical protein